MNKEFRTSSNIQKEFLFIMKPVKILCYVIVVFFSVYVSMNLSTSFGESPSLNRYEIPDDLGDWVTKNMTDNEFTHAAKDIVSLIIFIKKVWVCLMG
jgi:hypothetical protein